MTDSRFLRSEILYGATAQKSIESATVAVCGVGAVGSFAVEALARIGVGKFFLFDFDVVDITNINRQLCALTSTIGKLKVDVMRDRILDINPSAKVFTNNIFIDETTCADVIACGADVIVDAIDSLKSKSHLIAEALKKGVPIVSSMGAARKTDVSEIATAKLKKTINCPMAARLRKNLRALNIDATNMCVYSKEIPEPQTHLSRDENDGKKVIGSTPIITGCFGLHLANLALDEIRKKEI